MVEGEWKEGDEVSLFALGTILARGRARIAWWMFVGGALAALSVVSSRPIYMGSASFVPQGSDAGRSGLANLAGQFGVGFPAVNQSSSPDFYSELLKSRVLLAQIARDTFVVQEQSGRRVAFLDLFEIKQGPPKLREDQGETLLRRIVSSRVVKTTGVVEVSVETPWPSVSLAIITDLVDGVTNYNQRTRQGQAAAERKFIEGRLTMASADLREAEDRLERFLKMNRQIGNSPELAFDRERIQRDVTLKQQVFTSLTQAHEDARIREVRDTPVITLFEPPSVPALPEPRGRVKRVLLGVLLGGIVGAALVFMSNIMARHRSAGDADAAEFVGTLDEIRGDIFRPVRWVRQRLAR
jgi:uncharacterized protein involved in exopolysaccharide biosynthesis